MATNLKKGTKILVLRCPCQYCSKTWTPACRISGIVCKSGAVGYTGRVVQTDGNCVLVRFRTRTWWWFGQEDVEVVE